MIIPTDDPRAVAAVGAIHAGATWPLAEFPGSPQALLAAPAAWYAAATDEGGTTGIYRSGDAGRNWELYYRDPPDEWFRLAPLLHAGFRRSR